MYIYVFIDLYSCVLMHTHTHKYVFECKYINVCIRSVHFCLLFWFWSYLIAKTGFGFPVQLFKETTVLIVIGFDQLYRQINILLLLGQHYAFVIYNAYNLYGI